MEPNDCEVIISGAGPTGLLAAALLARNGVRVRIFDKSPTPAHESRALVVQARSIELFLNLGLAGELLNRGTIVADARMFVDGHARASLHFDDLGHADTPFSFILIVPQSETEAILNEEIQRLGVPVERQVEVTGFEQDGAGVIVRAMGADGAEFSTRAAYLIGADGAHSVVRKALGLSFEGAAYPENFLLADCRVEGLPFDDGFAIFLHGKHFAVYFPLPGPEKLGRIITLGPGHKDKNESIDKQGGADVPLSLVEEAFRAATQLDVKLSDSIWTSVYRVHHRGVDRYNKGRVFVAGDAAHIHSPAAGQGMNTGLQDAANLAWKLTLALRGKMAPDLLDSYHDERWPVGQRVLQVTDKMFSTMTAQSDWFAALRNVLVPPFVGVVMQAGFVREKAFHFISQLGIHYEKSGFVLDETPRESTAFWKNGPASGRRAPNALYARNQDVFGLLAGYRFHVLALSRQPLSSGEIGTLCEGLAGLPQPPGVGLSAHVIAHCANGRDERILRAESSQVFTTYGISQETPQALYLVRPDGYIAWRADSMDLPALAELLQGHFC